MIDDIFAPLIDSPNLTLTTTYWNDAKSQLKDMILKEVIGEDEPRSNYEFGNVCEAAWQQANWTRQEQRTKLNELFEGKDK